MTAQKKTAKKKVVRRKTKPTRKVSTPKKTSLSFKTGFWLGPLLTVSVVVVILLLAKLFTPKPPITPTTQDIVESTGDGETTMKEPELPTVNLEIASPAGWQGFDNNFTPEPTKSYYLDELSSALHIGSRFALHESGDICGGEPPCIEYGTFNAKVAGKTFTTPLFLSRNRQTGQNKYIFQFRLYGFKGATYISGKVASEEQLETIRTFLSSLAIN